MASVCTVIWLQRRPDLIRWHQEGVPFLEIARRFGVSKGAVSGQVYALRSRGLLPGGITPKSQAPNRKIVWTQVMDDELRRRRSEGLSYSAVGKAMGMGECTIKARVRALGLPGNPVGMSRDVSCRPRIWSDEDRDKVCRLYRVGFSLRQIGEQVGTTKKRVESLVRSLQREGVLFVRPKRASAARPSNIAPRTRKAAEGAPIRKRVAKAPAKAKGPLRPKVQHYTSIKEVLDSMTAPAKSGMALVDLQGMHCRWPLICDDGEVRYCGQGVTDRPYCAEHAARAFNGKERPRVPPAVLGLKQGGRVDA